MQVSRRAVTVTLILLCQFFAASWLCAQAKLPDTPVAEKFEQLIECLNQSEAERRQPFLKDAFADKSELDSRVDIAAELHKRFAPIVISKFESTKENSMVAYCTGNEGVTLEINLSVSSDDGHLITDTGLDVVAADEEQDLPPGMLPVNADDEKPAPESHGVWVARGYGYVFQITEDGLKVFHNTGKFGWEDDFDEDLYFVAGKDNKSAILTLHPLEPGYNVVRLDSLPEACTRELEWTPTELFEAFVSVMDTHYPFFEIRNIDWKHRVATQRANVNDEMSESELFGVFAEMLKDFRDGHLGLNTVIDGVRHKADVGVRHTVSRVREAFRSANESESDDTKKKSEQMFVRAWISRFKKSISEETIVSGEANEAGNGQLIWGRAHEKVGYLYIGGMGGYSYGGTDSQVAALHAAMNEILTSFADTDALIIDISFNGGGSDLFSLEIASHFADKRRVGFSKWPAGLKQYKQDRYVTPYVDVEKDGVMYTKPIYVVTNDVTASAAEIFTMCMRPMPHVTTVGKATEGALSDILPKTLPNGWEFYLSNEFYVDHASECHEGPGVPPDVEMDIFDPKDITQIGHSKSIKNVVAMALSAKDALK